LPLLRAAPHRLGESKPAKVGKSSLITRAQNYGRQSSDDILGRERRLDLDHQPTGAQRVPALYYDRRIRDRILT